MGPGSPKLVVLGTINKQAEQTSKQHSSMASASVPASRFLLDELKVEDKLTLSFTNCSWPCILLDNRNCNLDSTQHQK